MNTEGAVCVKIDAAAGTCQDKDCAMKRRESDQGGRRRTQADSRVRPVGSPYDQRRDLSSPGRRRFDGLSIEQLWDRVEALTRQTQEHAEIVDGLPQLLAAIEAGLAHLRRRAARVRRTPLTAPAGPYRRDDDKRVEAVHRSEVDGAGEGEDDV